MASGEFGLLLASVGELKNIDLERLGALGDEAGLKIRPTSSGDGIQSAL